MADSSISAPPPAAVTLTAQAFLAVPGTPWTPALAVGVITSVTLTVITGTATVTDQNGTVVAGLPVQYSASWSASDNDTLTAPQSIASVGGTVVVHWTER